MEDFLTALKKIINVKVSSFIKYALIRCTRSLMDLVTCLRFHCNIEINEKRLCVLSLNMKFSMS